MGKTTNSGLAHGTKGSPQQTLEQENLSSALNEKKSVSQKDMKILQDAGVKYNKDNVIFATKNKAGELNWLEVGNSKVGLEHMYKQNHIQQICDYVDIGENEVVSYVKDMISNGKIIRTKKETRGGRMVTSKIIKYKDKTFLVAVGTNGFIVTIHPL